MLEYLFDSLRKIPVIRKRAIELENINFKGHGLRYIDGKPLWIQNGKAYSFFVLANLSGRFLQDPQILEELSIIVSKIVDFSKVDKILTLETMGIHVSTSLSLKVKKPLAIVGKVKYVDDISGWVPSYQIEVVKRAKRSEPKMYINGVYPGDRILLFDSVISTGDSFTAVINALDKRRIEITDAVAILEKEEYNGVEFVKEHTGITVKTLIKMKIVNVVERQDELFVYADLKPSQYFVEALRNKSITKTH